MGGAWGSAGAVKAPAVAADHIALLSDVHVSGSIFGRSMGNNLAGAVEQVLALPKAPQEILVAGDCAHLTGKGGDYKEFVRKIQPLADAGLPVHMTMGNHDDREHFWEALPGEEAEANAKLRRQSMVIEGTHANWFMLDSLNKTNSSPGELGKDQLEWLAAELDARASKPALIMLHHDPVRNGGQGSLADADALFAVTRPRRQVKAMFFGHTHVWSVVKDRSGMHLVNLPATGYTLWGRSFLGWVDCKVYKADATLKVHTLKANGKENGLTSVLKWRA
jgi:3',5'-cyclic AMP phosphodiesterase CpdA